MAVRGRGGDAQREIVVLVNLQARMRAGDTLPLEPGVRFWIPSHGTGDGESKSALNVRRMPRGICLEGKGRKIP